MFVIQQANLRQSELNKGDMSTWKNRVEQAFNDPKQNVNVEVSAYASPMEVFHSTKDWQHSVRKILLPTWKKN